MAKQWTKNAAYACTVNTSETTYASGSASTVYAGINSSLKGNDNNAILIFDTSDFPSYDILKYKKDVAIKFEYNGVAYQCETKAGTFVQTTISDVNCRPYYLDVAPESVADYNYTKLSNNWKTISATEFDYLNDYNIEDPTQTVINKFRHPTTVLRIWKAYSEDIYGARKVKKSETSLNLYYTDIKPKVECKYPTSAYRSNQYTFSWNYSHEKNASQKSYTLKWTSSTGATGTVSGKTENSYTFPEYTFPVGTLRFDITVTSIDDAKGSYYTSSTINIATSVPEVEATTPINGEEFYRAKAITFKWNYSDPAGLAQKLFKIEYTNNGVTKTIQQNSANKFYTFPAYAFAEGVVTYYITVTNTDGYTSSRMGPYTANAINSVPQAEATTPIAGEGFYRADAVTFKWNYSDAANVIQKAFKIEYTNNGETKIVEQITTNQFYTFLKNTFAPGLVTYYITVTNRDNVSAKYGPFVAIAELSVPSVVASYPVNENVAMSQPFGIAWTMEEPISTGQKSFKIDLEQSGENITVEEEGSANTYIFDGYSFSEGRVTYSITVTNNDGLIATAGPYTFNVVPSYPTVEGVYPRDVLIKKSSPCTISWNYDETVAVGQKSYIVDIRQNGTTSQYSKETSEHYCTIEADVLSTGKLIYSITVTNNDNQSATCGPYECTVVGDTEAPNIVEASNNATPTIKWEVESQEAYEVAIYNEQSEQVYASGLEVSTTREHIVNKLLVNGRYTISVRVINEYGYYSQWGTLSHVIEAECQSSITNAHAFATNDYGAALFAEYTGGEAYVIRRRFGREEIEVLGKYVDGFIDYTIPGDSVYQYAVRLFDVGVLDSPWTVVQNEVKEVVLRDVSNPSKYIYLWLTESERFEIYHEDERDRTLTKCIGRTFPVKEQGEWINSTRRFEAHVTEEEYELLKDIELNSMAVGYQGPGEYMRADMSVSDSGSDIHDGRKVTITLTRIDG